ncbi:hypothetical protein NMY22_g5327 [Coprinellus aureogranulatus]|nr:hypothetical protein NMY22_g5327 [Coprinellus aureogranulatus]
MPPKKKPKKTEPASSRKAGLKSTTGKASAPSSSSENPANARQGILRLPPELIANVLSNYKSIGNFTSIPDRSEKEEARRQLQAPAAPGPIDLLSDEPVLPRAYLDRPDALRALSQTCVAYRQVFLPLLFERLEVCVTTRPGNPMRAFYKHIGEGLERKCSGLAKRPDLWEMVGKVHVSLTRYQTETVLPAFLKCMKNLPNLHTIKVLHAHTQMTTAIKNTFERASLPTIRTVVVPAFCHEILRACPEVRSVWCTEQDGSKLVGALGKGKCNKVEELRGCDLTEHMMKRLVKIAPNLRVIQIGTGESDEKLAILKSFKQLHTIDIAVSSWSPRGEPKPSLKSKAQDLQKLIKACREILKASPSQERKYLRLCWWRERGVDDGEREFVLVPLDPE